MHPSVKTVKPTYDELEQRVRDLERIVSFGALSGSSIAERKQTTEQYRAIFENAVEGFFQSTPEGRFIRVNHAFSKMCGYASPAEMVSDIKDIGGEHYVRRQDREVFRRLISERGRAVDE
jgi:PAS domain-containing protein